MQVPHEHRAAGRILRRRGLLSPYVHTHTHFVWSAALCFVTTGPRHTPVSTPRTLRDFSRTDLALPARREYFSVSATQPPPRALAKTVSPHCAHPSASHAHRSAPRHCVSYIVTHVPPRFTAPCHMQRLSRPTPLLLQRHLRGPPQTLHRSSVGPTFSACLASSLARLPSLLLSLLRSLPLVAAALVPPHAPPPSSSPDRPMPKGRRVGGRCDRRGHGARASCDVLQQRKVRPEYRYLRLPGGVRRHGVPSHVVSTLL